MTHADGGKVKRYDCGRSFGGYVEAGEFESPDGAYVHYSSYALLEQQLERAQGELRERLSQLQYTRDERDANYRLLCNANKRAEQAEARVRELDLALQSLTPGGSEYVNAPQTCVAYVQRIKTDCVEAHKENVRMRREFEAALATATARVKWLERLHTQFLLRLPQDDTWYEEWLAAEPKEQG